MSSMIQIVPAALLLALQEPMQIPKPALVSLVIKAAHSVGMSQLFVQVVYRLLKTLNIMTRPPIIVFQNAQMEHT